MKIETQITFKEYLKLQYILNYRNKWVLVASTCGLIMLFTAILSLFGVVPRSENFYFGLFFGLYVLITPFLIYRAALKNFKTHKILHEPITYEFLPDNMIVTSSYSRAELPWEKIHMIKEFRNWFLIYQSTKIANLVPKTSLSKDQVTEAKHIFKNTRGPQIKLKR